MQIRKGWNAPPVPPEETGNIAGEGFKSGFKVVERSGSSYFDFSSEALAEIISGYLNPVLAGIVRDAARGS